MITALHRHIIRFSGERADCCAFLQSLLATDITTLSSDHPLYAVLLTPQGKFVADGLLIEHEDACYWEVHASLADTLLPLLIRYRLRRAIEITLPKMAVYWAATAPESSPLNWQKDPRHTSLGWRALADASTDTPVDEHPYHQARITAGIAEGVSDLITEKDFPLPFGLHLHGGISFEKGCYVGQEVTTRSHHRGGVRKEIRSVHQAGNTLKTGAALFNQQKKVGELRSCEGEHGLALVEKTADFSQLSDETGVFFTPIMG